MTLQRCAHLRAEEDERAEADEDVAVEREGEEVDEAVAAGEAGLVGVLLGVFFGTSTYVY